MDVSTCRQCRQASCRAGTVVTHAVRLVDHRRSVNATNDEVRTQWAAEVDELELGLQSCSVPSGTDQTVLECPPRLILTQSMGPA